MNKSFIFDFIKKHKLAVLSTSTPENKPEAALIGIAISRDLEIVFDTVKTSRKYFNLARNPQVAVVIGWDNETTIQYEGRAVELNGPGSEIYKEIYFEAFHDGRHRATTWPDIVHFKIQPRWIRYSNYNEPLTIEELTF